MIKDKQFMAYFPGMAVWLLVTILAYNLRTFIDEGNIPELWRGVLLIVGFTALLMGIMEKDKERKK